MSRRAQIVSAAAVAGCAVIGLVVGSAAAATAAPSAPGTTINVSTSANLLAALKAVKPGDTISLANGTYSGTFIGTTSGTASAPITLTGGSGAILTNGDTSGAIGSGYGFHLEASYWKLTGFSVDNSSKGVVLDGANNDVLDGLTVHHIGDEGIHLREFSSNDIVEHCDVYDTGTGTPGYGEGIYVGTANGNWGTYTHGKPDLSNDDQILDNTVGPNVRADNLDVKEATVGGTISGNTFNSQGETGANYSDDVVAVKGNNYTVTNNTIVNPRQDGFEVENLWKKAGCGNTFSNNKLNMAGAKTKGYGFNVKDQSVCKASPNVVGASNTVTNPGKGVSTIPVTPGV